MQLNVFVFQGEFAVVSNKDSVLVASDDATICVIAVVIGSEKTLLAHVDRASQAQQLMQEAQSSLGSNCMFWLVGGELELGKAISDSLLKAFASFKNVGTYLAQGHRGCSVVAGDIGSFRLIKKFEGSREPNRLIRAGRWLWSQDKNLACCFRDGAFTVAERPVVGPDASTKKRMIEMLQLDDEELLQMFSTSPDLEDTDFVPNLREVLNWWINQTN